MTRRRPPHAPSRRHALVLIASSAAALALPAQAAQLPLSDSLPTELARALAQGQPLVVMVSLAGCPFCKVARDSYLAPLHERQGVPVVQIDMRSDRATQALDGSATTHDALVRAWRIKVAPTVLFFGRSGREVAERLEGGYLPDFYGSYLDDRLAQARQALKP